VPGGASCRAIDLFESNVPELNRRERATLIWISAEELAAAAAARPRVAAPPDHRRLVAAG